MPLSVFDDPVDVMVSFAQGRAQPRRMQWNQRIYDIKQINLIHGTREGEKRVFYFSVSDLTNYFKLRFDTETLEWRLIELYAE